MSLNTEKVVPFPPVIDYKKQSVEVPGTRRPGQTAHYRSTLWEPLNASTPGVLLTIDAVFLTGLKVGRHRPLLGHRPLISQNPVKYANHYVWLTFGQVDDRRRYIGSALDHLFKAGEIGGGEYRTVGLWSQNRPEWQLVDIALASYAMVSVSLYDTLGKDAVEYIINHAHTTVVFTSADHLPTLIKLAPSAKMLKLIISFDPINPETKTVLKEWCSTHNIQLMELHELEEIGKANLIDPIPATPDQLASICYTSGTTGHPKGALLKHKHLASAAHAGLYGLEMPDDGIMMSYLPLAHIYGRVCELATIAVGAKIGYFTGDPLRLIEDAQVLRPNFFPSVPRVLNRVYQAAMAAGNVPGLKGTIFKKAVAAKLERFHATGDNVHALWDRLVFRKIHGVLGGRLSLVICGSAPINADVMDFLKIAFSCDVVEGYGLTETCAVCAKSLPADPTASGTIGPPVPINEVKLLDVPAMNYTAEDKPYPRGELLIRGLNCFNAYYKDEKSTKSTVDEEGWVHTGDVAAIDECGRIRIIDRVKNIMKLAQGEYVATEKIENTYGACPIIAQIFVHGDSLQSFLLGVVIPDTVQLASIASEIFDKRVSPEDFGELVKACGDDRIKKRVLDVLTAEGKKNGLKGFEMVKKIHLSLDPFSVQDGTLTPTLKLRRKDAYNKFKKELDALYSLGSDDAQTKL